MVGKNEQKRVFVRFSRIFVRFPLDPKFDRAEPHRLEIFFAIYFILLLI
jgi:hypothetical protein